MSIDSNHDECFCSCGSCAVGEHCKENISGCNFISEEDWTDEMRAAADLITPEDDLRPYTELASEDESYD
jgi:hypothetical protein